MSRSEYHAWAIKANRDRHTLPSLDLLIPTDPSKQPVCKSNVRVVQQKYIALPSELMFEILNHLLDADEQGSLYNATLVSRHWMNCATPLLFRHPKIHSTYRWATFLLTLMRPNQQYAFGEFVRSINLSSSYEFPENTDTTNTNPSDGGDLIDALENMADRWANVETTNISNSKITPTITLSTSSFLQVASCCPNLTFLDLSNTALFCDSLILETGEYVSSIQTFALQPGLTHVRIELDQAIRAIGTQCPALRHVNMQACDWVTAKVIWSWVTNCPKLQKLDARRCLRCGIERLTNACLNMTNGDGNRDQQSVFTKTTTNQEPWTQTANLVDHEDSLWINSQIAEYSVPRPSVFARDRRPSTSVVSDAYNPNALSSLLPPPSVPTTLRSLVYDILREAKESGITDVNWLHDD
ncbi:hypothetical protein BC943DRAFT_358716 [Umbelopsis sp. AD052]|nr:hypothetical protein BC943DRAFT_358716 [Umbelopsis sp. AD052]